MEDSIGIIGYGVVGHAIDNTMRKSFKTIKYDKYGDYDDFESILKCDIVFISVPTPFDCEINKVDDSAILESLKRLRLEGYKGTVIIKSTVPPSTTDSYINKFKMNIVFNPEFLRESTTPNEDFENQDCVVIGTKESDLFEEVKSMYSKVLVPQAKYYHTTSLEAEMIKYSQNTLLASRVAIANMIYDACTNHEVEYDKIRNIAFDSFDIIGPSMNLVPGPDGKRGFGGKCLPKDIRGFSTIHESKLLEEIINYNDHIRDDLHKFLENYKT